jgi:ubiquinone/menaquinone biosynthesis C-methylase UbiE
MDTDSWESAEKWYDSCVGEKGHHYHKSVIFPYILKLFKEKDSVLDLGCGQGVLERQLPESITYYGVDNSKSLIEIAKKTTKNRSAQFFVGDATQKLPFEKKDFDWACFILSLQNMEHPKKAIHEAAKHLKPGGKLLIVLNHPCFRIPRQSHWGVDANAKLQYRRINSYMTPQTIPIQTHPGKGNLSDVTYSYHYPLSSYFAWTASEGLSTIDLQEWCSDKKSEGAKKKMEDRARVEIPLFLAIVSQKLTKI